MAIFRYSLTFCLMAFVCCGCRTNGAYQSANATDASQLSPAGTMTVAETGTPSSPDESAPAVQQTSLESIAIDDSGVPQAIDPIPIKPEPADSLSLSGTISLALANNPDLVALRATERVGVATLGVAQTYPFNPFVQVQATPYQHLDNVNPRSTYHYVLMMQRFQLAGQQGHREDAAFSSLNGIRWNIHQAELQTSALTAQLYFTALYQNGLLQIAEANHTNNERLLETLEKRFDAGSVAAADVATIRIDTNSSRRQLQLARANHQTALRDLRRQLGYPPYAPLNFDGDLQQIDWQLPAGETLVPAETDQGIDKDSTARDAAWVASWAATRPDVLAAHANIDMARANLRLASADRVPDLQLGPYYQGDPDGMTRLGFRAEMNLPIINSGKPLETQRAAELSQQNTIWRQALLRAELEGQAAYERYKLAYVEFHRGDNEAVSELPRELQSLEQQLAEGEVDVVRVIQARTSMLQNQRALLDQLNELAQSAALLVGATGMPVELLLGQSL